MKKLIAYTRVSTKEQGLSGLGLEGQVEAIRRHAEQSGGIVCKTFTEVETGKNCNRPEIAKAIAYAKLVGGTLVIAKLDRLARNVAFVANLMESKVDFVACDNPHATPFQIHILAAVAEFEAKTISDRTRTALAQSTKLKGRANPKWGTGPKAMKPEDREKAWRAGIAKGVAAASASRQRIAQQHKMAVKPVVEELRAKGLSLRAIAAELNSQGIKSPRGKSWSASAIRKVLL